MNRYTMHGRGSVGNIRPAADGTWCKYADHEAAVAAIREREFEAMKRWLGNGEMDLNLMARTGSLTRSQIVQICRTLVDSPWFEGVPLRSGS